MRIGIDARFIKRPGGIGRYTDELLKALRALRSPHEFVAVSPDVSWYSVAEQLRMPRVIDRERFDLFHFPHWNVPLGVKTPFVLTIHDLLILEHPSRRATTLDPIRYSIKRLGHRVVLRSAIGRARVVIVPSNFVRNDLCRRFPSAAKKTVVIPEGVGHETKVTSFKLQVSSPSLLYVGNAYPHKNLERLIAAFAKVRESVPNATLTIAGYDDYFFRRLKAAWSNVAEAFRPPSDGNLKVSSTSIRFVSTPTDDQIEELYASATVFVIPSLTEGFGLTPLEAMARGVPVASSRGGSLPEVLGDAAEYFEPTDTEGMTAVIVELLRNDERRAELAQRGQTQAAKYSWKKTAEKTLAVYETAFKKN